jgi:hypothetical protein
MSQSCHYVSSVSIVPAFDVAQHGYSDIWQHFNRLMLNNSVCNEYLGHEQWPKAIEMRALYTIHGVVSLAFAGMKPAPSRCPSG